MIVFVDDRYADTGRKMMRFVLFATLAIALSWGVLHPFAFGTLVAFEASADDMTASSTSEAVAVVPAPCSSEDKCQASDCHNAIISASSRLPSVDTLMVWAVHIRALRGAPGRQEPDPPKPLA